MISSVQDEQFRFWNDTQIKIHGNEEFVLEIFDVLNQIDTVEIGHELLESLKKKNIEIIITSANESGTDTNKISDSKFKSVIGVNFDELIFPVKIYATSKSGEIKKKYKLEQGLRSIILFHELVHAFYDTENDLRTLGYLKAKTFDEVDEQVTITGKTGTRRLTDRGEEKYRPKYYEHLFAKQLGLNTRISHQATRLEIHQPYSFDYVCKLVKYEAVDDLKKFKSQLKTLTEAQKEILWKEAIDDKNKKVIAFLIEHLKPNAVTKFRLFERALKAFQKGDVLQLLFMPQKISAIHIPYENLVFAVEENDITLFRVPGIKSRLEELTDQEMQKLVELCTAGITNFKILSVLMETPLGLEKINAHLNITDYYIGSARKFIERFFDKAKEANLRVNEAVVKKLLPMVDRLNDADLKKRCDDYLQKLPAKDNACTLL